MDDAALPTTTPRPAVVRPEAVIGFVAALGFLLAWGAASAGQAVPTPAVREVTRPATNQGVEWKSLSQPQRLALGPLERDWASFDAAQKLKWIELAQRFPKMSEEERQRIQGRMADWARMTPTERGQARLHFLQARRAAPDDRGARWEDYQALPNDRKKELAARAEPPIAAKSLVAKPGTAGESSKLISSPNFPLPPKPVAPTVIQARPGATTTLVSKLPSPPPHQQVGMPKIAATPGFIDKNTLLPQRGPQGAATLSIYTTTVDLEPVPRP